MNDMDQNEKNLDDLDIFVDEDELFPITIHYRVVRDDDGNKIRVETSSSGGEGWRSITGNFSQPSSQAFGEVLEQATIINHMDFRPLLRTWSLRDGTLMRFMKNWDVKSGKFGDDGKDIFIPISYKAISEIHYEISQSLFLEYMNKTGLAAELKAALRDEQTVRMRAREQMTDGAIDIGDGMRGATLPNEMHSVIDFGFPMIPESHDQE